jgi:hypothetical protein
MRSVALALLLAMLMFSSPWPAHAQQWGRCDSDIALSQEYAAWAGPWAKHGAGLNLREDGCGALSWRTYQPCTLGVYDGVCDPSVNGEIGHGGKAVFVLAVIDGGAASGRILARTAQTSPPNFGIKGDGTMGVEWDGAEWRFCRPWAWAPVCGA